MRRPRLPLAGRFDAHVLVGFSNWTSRAISMAVQLVSIPLLMQALGVGSFAAYSIVASTLAWFALADLGMGIVLQNRAVLARQEATSISEDFGTMVVAGLASGMLIITAVWLVAPWVGPGLMESTGIGESKASIAFASAATLFVLSAVGGLSYKLMYGLGYGVRANGLMAISSLLGLLIVWIASQFWSGEELLVPALLSYALPLAVVPLLALLVLFRGLGTFTWRGFVIRFLSIWSSSREFLLVALFAVGTLNLDYLILSQFVGAADIATYNILSKIFGIAFGFYAGMAAASSMRWLSLSRKGEWADLTNSIIQHMILGSLAMIILATLLAFGANSALNLVAPGSAIELPSLVILLFAIYGIVRIVNDTFVILMQCLDQGKILAKVIPIQALASVLAQVALIQVFGMKGVVMGLSVACMSTVCLILPRRFNQLKRQNKPTVNSNPI